MTTILVLSIYSISFLEAPYFFWDDDWMVVENPFLIDMSRANIRQLFIYPHSGQYSPINSIFYILLINTFGMDPLALHVAVVLVHIVNVYLVFIFISKLLQLAEKNNFSYNQIQIIAGLISFIFGISSIQIESVAWISASKIVLYSLFFLLAIIFFLNYLNNKSVIQLSLSFFTFVIALGCKEQAVVLPCILVLIIIYAKIPRKKYFLALTPYFILSILFGIYTLIIQNDGESQSSVNDYYPFYQRVLLSTYSIVQYIVKTLIPIRQWVFYSFPMKIGENIPPIFYFYPILIFGICVFLIKSYIKNREKNGFLLFGSLFFLINIFLTLHILPMSRYSLMADRYLYIPLIGIYYVVIILLIRYYNKLKKIKSRNLLIYTTIFYVLLILLRSFLYIKEWSHFWSEDVLGY